MPLFAHYGVQLWVPAVGGPIDPTTKPRPWPLASRLSAPPGRPSCRRPGAPGTGRVLGQRRSGRTHGSPWPAFTALLTILVPAENRCPGSHARHTICPSPWVASASRSGRSYVAHVRYPQSPVVIRCRSRRVLCGREVRDADACNIKDPCDASHPDRRGDRPPQWRSLYDPPWVQI